MFVVQPVDDILVQRAQQGDWEAFAALVERYQAKLYNYALRMVANREDAADITQEAFLRAYQALPRLRDNTVFITWLFRIATNILHDSYRRQTHYNLLMEEKITGEADVSASAEEQVVQKQQHQTLLQALAGLPAMYREPLVMRYISELTYEQIGNVLGLPIRTVETRIYRGKQKLRQACITWERG